MFLGEHLWLCRTYRDSITYNKQYSYKKRDCIITLLDLKNTFGEVDRNLLFETLKIYHVPDDIITLIVSV